MKTTKSQVPEKTTSQASFTLQRQAKNPREQLEAPAIVHGALSSSGEIPATLGLTEAEKAKLQADLLSIIPEIRQYVRLLVENGKIGWSELPEEKQEETLEERKTRLLFFENQLADFYEALKNKQDFEILLDQIAEDKFFNSDLPKIQDKSSRNFSIECLGILYIEYAQKFLSQKDLLLNWQIIDLVNSRSKIWHKDYIETGIYIVVPEPEKTPFVCYPLTGFEENAENILELYSDRNGRYFYIYKKTRRYIEKQKNFPWMKKY